MKIRLVRCLTVFGLLQIAMIVAVPSTVHAVTVRGLITGTVTTSAGWGFQGDIDTDGIVVPGLFGEDAGGGTFVSPIVGDVNGATVTGSFTYDTDLAPPNTTTFPGEYIGRYHSIDDPNDWMSMSVSINGVTVSSNDTDSEQTVRFIDAIHLPPVFALEEESFVAGEFTDSNIIDGNERVRNRVVISMSIEEFMDDIFFAGMRGALPIVFFSPWEDNDTTDSGVGTYGILQFVEDQTTFELIDYYNSQGTFSIDSLTFQVVPLPSAFWLFGTTLGLPGWLKRRSNWLIPLD